MSKRVLGSIDVQITGDEQVNHVLQLFAEGFDSPYLVINEYLLNSFKSARTIYLEHGKTLPRPIEIKVDVNTRNNDVRILDNCKGMTKDTLMTLGDKTFTLGEDPWMKDGSKIGIHTFRSFFRELTIRTKAGGGKLLEISLRRGAENIRKNVVYEMDADDDDFPYPSGTLVILSGFEPTKHKSPGIDPKKLVEDIEARHEQILRIPKIKVSVLENGGNEIVCGPFRRSPGAVVYGVSHQRISWI